LRTDRRLARLLFDDQADGSLIRRDRKVVGSSLIRQPFSAARYFHPRPSAAGDGYDASASSGSNLGPTNEAFIGAVADRVAAYRRENRIPADVPVPVDAVTASASGLDPHISPANARLQAPRVARARHLAAEQVLVLVEEQTERRALGFLGEPGVNVLELNLALDDLVTSN
jgi:K+-transporting ATPase ATPase C chain